MYFRLEIFVILIFGICSMSNGENSTEIPITENPIDTTENLCWPSNGIDSCEIVANITLNSDFVFPIEFKCFDESGGGHAKAHEKLKKQLASTRKIELDGCKIPSGTDLRNFGLGFIPNVTEILDTLKIKRFDFDVLKTDLIYNFTVLRELSLESNKIDSLFVNENVNLKQVKILKLKNNKIGYLSFNTFEKLEELFWENEDSTNFINPSMFKKIPLKIIEFKSIKIPVELFENFPTTLETLHVTKIKFSNSTLNLTNNGVLKEIVLTENDLPRITLHEHKDIRTVEFLNLSGNCLHEVILRNFTQLKELDLSRNRISALEKESFLEMKNLEKLFLDENNLLTFHLNFFNKSVNSLEFIDLSHNKLKKIGLTENTPINLQLQIKIDGNDLNCEWLQKFFVIYPEKFQIFRYEKFTSKVNINGLECFSNCLNLTLFENDTETVNASTIRYDQLAVESLGKKNQRAEALIIIILLPLGVAFLSVLLFLWIKCQRIFHGSFYRTLPIIGGSPDRFDVVRHIPSAPQEDYEVPLTCGNVLHDSPGYKCTQNCTLTYEDLSGKEDIYQEIPGDKIVNNMHYDHLNME